SLSPGDRAALLAGQEVVFRPDAASPDRRLSAAWIQEILQSCSDEDPVDQRPIKLADLPDIKLAQLSLQMNCSELGEVVLIFRMGTSFTGRWGAMNALREGRLAVGRSP